MVNYNTNKSKNTTSTLNSSDVFSGSIHNYTSLIEDPSSPFYLHPSENHSLVILTPALTSINYAS